MVFQAVLLFVVNARVRSPTAPLSGGASAMAIGERNELRRRRFARRRMFHVLGCIKIEDLAALAGARVDGAQVLAPFHFPNGGDYAVFFHGLVGYLFGLSRRRRVLRIRDGGLAFRHTDSAVLLFRFLNFVSTILAQRQSGCLAKGSISVFRVPTSVGLLFL